MRLVLASNNAKKLAELRTLLAPLSLDLVSQDALGIGEADEPHATFLENALAKARHAAQACGGAAIADDSGLCVDVLGGLPGVRSARYAQIDLGRGAREEQRARQDAANNLRLLQTLEAQADRRAAYLCVLVALRHAEDPEPLVGFGRWAGEILSEPRGSGGFGYDPLMFMPTLGSTVAQMDAAVKNAHSHRAIAAAALLSQMREVWHLG